MPAFLKAFDAASAQQLPISGNRFVVDSSVEEFTALMFRKSPKESVSLVGPDGQRVDMRYKGADTRWHHTDDYDLVTIKRPLEGEWIVDGELAPSSRITVVSDLSLRVKTLAHQCPVGGSVDLQLALQESDQIVTREIFCGCWKSWLNRKRRLSKRSPGHMLFDTRNPPKTGVFATKAMGFVEPGDYLVQVEFDGKSFQRRYSHQIQVRLPFEVELIKGYNDNSQVQYTHC